MSESNPRIECAVHGRRTAAYICTHLARGKHKGFNLAYDPETPDALFPDAWCDKCEALLDQEGEWNEAVEKFTKLKLICSACYESARDKHWIQDDEAFEALVAAGFAYLEERQQQFVDTYQLNDHPRWDWSQDTGLLIFSDAGEAKVEAVVSFVGSVSTTSNSWMWAWANQSLTERVKANSRAIRELGEAEKFRKLVAALWAADEVDGWQMTGIMARELGAIGAYRTPDDSGYTYMIVESARWVDGRSLN